MTRTQTTSTVVLVAVVALLVMAGACSRRSNRFETPESRLRWLWAAYTRNYVRPEGYVVDPLRGGGLVTSEAQSYALLQAVWLDDRATFEHVLQWTRANLQRPDGLHSWLWDPRGGGRIVDPNTATDADVDIAFALALASVTFKEPQFARDARIIVRAIRLHSRLDLARGFFPSAGNWAGEERVTNLSYFAPYAFEYFNHLDPGAGWDGAIETGYDLIGQTADGPHGRLPADFVRISTTGRVEPLPEGSTLSRVFSFDAIRILWRVDMDCRLTARPRACTNHSLIDTLTGILQRDHRLVTMYDLTGTALSDIQSPSVYGAFLPAFTRVHPSVASDWRSSQLSDDALSDLVSASDRYYDANWVWFGLAVADGWINAHTPPPATLPTEGVRTP